MARTWATEAATRFATRNGASGKFLRFTQRRSSQEKLHIVTASGKTRGLADSEPAPRVDRSSASQSREDNVVLPQGKLALEHPGGADRHGGLLARCAVAPSLEQCDQLARELRGCAEVPVNRIGVVEAIPA